jgi:tRNA pseudouridine38-40 synthase
MFYIAFCFVLVMAKSTFTYKLLIAYDGTHFSGWQIQKNAVSIQCLIERALSTILRTQVNIVGSGRTDAGVHALAQTAHFKVSVPIDMAKTLASLNGLLPADIRILSIDQADSTFHARYSASSKIYHYHLHLGKTADPFKRHFAYHVFHPVDITLLKKAAQYFIGTHDFTSFASEATQGSAAKNPVRTLYRIDIVEEKGGLRLEFEGNGFLYKMVRNIVGTLLDVCAGKIDLDQIPVILEAKDRRRAGRAAPPHGLYLMEVKYDASVSKCLAPSLLPSAACSASEGQMSTDSTPAESNALSPFSVSSKPITLSPGCPSREIAFK